MKDTLKMMNFNNPDLKKLFEVKLDEAIENRFNLIQNPYGVESSKPDDENS